MDGLHSTLDARSGHNYNKVREVRLRVHEQSRDERLEIVELLFTQAQLLPNLFGRISKFNGSRRHLESISGRQLVY